MEHHHQPSPMIGKLTLDSFYKILPRVKKNLKEATARNLGYEALRARRFLNEAIHYGESKEIIANHMKMCQSLALGVYRNNLTLEPFTVYTWDEEILVTPGKKKVQSDYLVFPEWKHAFDLSVLLRKMTDISFLVEVPESHLVTSFNSTPEFDIAYFRFLRHFFTGGGDTASLIIKCFELLLIPSDNPVRDEYLNAIVWPELKLYEAMIRRDQNLLNERMKKANKDHNQYYGHELRRYDVYGWVSLAIMAVLALVNDNTNMELPKSPYAVPYIIQGNY